MKIPVYNKEGKEVGKTLLPKEVFELRVNPDLVHQVVVSQMANKRQGIAHTKDRSEVRGGGRKPWRQKGTGRARVGSIRSPLWRGGGVTFGPRKEKVFKKIIPKKMRKRALLMVLSAKAENNFLVLLDKLELDKPKTKIVSEILDKLPCKKESTLITLPRYDKNIVLAVRNIPGVSIQEARNLNALGILSFKYLMMPKETIKIIKEMFTK